MRKEQKNLYQITNVCVCVSECVLQNDTLNFKENKIVMPKQKEENKLMNKIKKNRQKTNDRIFDRKFKQKLYLNYKYINIFQIEMNSI